MDPRGYVSIVLHAHLPYVRHPEFGRFLEEEWLYEAIVETYLPLIERYRQLVREGVDFRFTMTVTPSLASMLSDDLLKRRALKHLNTLIELADKEKDRTRRDPVYHPLAVFYAQRYRRLRALYVDELGGDLIQAFRELWDDGCLEIMTCGATHGLLPLLQNVPGSVDAQVSLGVQAHQHFFGRKPRGIWLPECAYYQGLDEILARNEIRFFLLDSHGVLFAEPRPMHGVYAPVYTPAGLAGFARDPESSKQVWSSKEGYPGDYDYRDFYRDIGYDLDFDYVRAFVQPTGLRKFTGIKYHRITGATDHKEPYQPDVAEEKVALHASNFLFNRERQVEYLHSRFDRQPLIVAPYDAELFGHWWFEGPDFLYLFAKKVCYDTGVFKLTTPMEYIERMPVQQACQPCPSSWGDKGYYDVWLNGTNDWIYPHLHAMARRMRELAQTFPQADEGLARALNQCARELLLAQSSDWAFLISTGTAVEYATQRTLNHIGRFLKLYDQIMGARIDQGYLTSLEEYDNLFPFVDYRVWGR